ncbi:MAG: hypothetical protein WCB97_14240 [Thiobacillus sp.]
MVEYGLEQAGFLLAIKHANPHIFFYLFFGIRVRNMKAEWSNTRSLPQVKSLGRRKPMLHKVQ